jgi:hypothetical protein
MQRISEYRKNAEECRKLAASITNPRHKRTLQEMAAAWDMLAEERKLDIAESEKD